MESDEEVEFCFRYLSHTGGYLSTSVLAEPVEPPITHLARTLDAIAEDEGSSDARWASILYDKDASMGKNQILVIPCGCADREQPTCYGCRNMRAAPTAADLPHLEKAFGKLESEYSGEDGYPYDLVTVLEGRGLWAQQMEAAITGRGRL